ncbi:cadherin-99C-like [Bactrocera neohumeralis]|uniref:cadherin-99C-like n=1 Tax=Bactrocera neohumeralis TaxID=98809 RepID=UPI0021657BA7|nr:cadherin-99C-like [Bactrocera neohumeralis]
MDYPKLIGQHTTPPELPIYGDPYTEIALNLVFTKGNPTFLLDGKKLQLLQPLDRDEENLSHIVFQVSCSIRKQPTSDAAFRLLCAYLMSTTMRRASGTHPMRSPCRRLLSPKRWITRRCNVII